MTKLKQTRFSNSFDLLVYTSYYISSQEQVTGGIGYRFQGLYGSLIQYMQSHFLGSFVYWFSQADNSCRCSSNRQLIACKKGMLRSTVFALVSSLKRRQRLLVIVAYPYGTPSYRKVMDYIFSLILLKFFSGCYTELFVDDFDPPTELAGAFDEKRTSFHALVYTRMLEKVTLKLASKVIVVSKSFKNYLSTRYGISKDKMLVVSNGSMLTKIRYVPPRCTGPLQVLYSGSVLERKDVGKLVSAIMNLRAKGLDVKLVLTGAKLMELPSCDWLTHSSVNDWTLYVKEYLETSDVCVIPYPRNLFWDYTVLAKTFDYMSAGKPIITTNLKETSRLIKQANCGLIAKDWNEFEKHIETLYFDRALATKLGYNGRKTVETKFNYQSLARELIGASFPSSYEKRAL